MVLKAVLLDHNEKFIKFLDPNLISLEETREKFQIDRISMNYSIDDVNEARKLFRVGHKIWVSGDDELKDCLYVINESLKEDCFSENSVEFEPEEVLTELNYAPLFSSTKITSANGFDINSDGAVKVDRFFLDYWFGDYFNIGIIQDCLSPDNQLISPLGTMTLMELLRFIEKETDNVFITRYQKDRYNNTIHRFIDFLNPKVSNSQFNFGFTYELEDETEDPNEATLEDFGEDPEEIQDETYDDGEDEVELIHEGFEQVDVTNFELRIFEKGNSEPVTVSYKEDNEIVEFESIPSELLGFDGECKIYDFEIDYKNGVLTISNSGWVYDSSLASLNANSYLLEHTTSEKDFYVELGNELTIQIYNSEYERIEKEYSFSQLLVDTRDDVLDLGYNTENIELEIDESETFKAVAPLISSDGDLNKTELHKVINEWINLSVRKGSVIPMIVEKITGTNYPSNTRNHYDNYWNYCIKPSNTSDGVEYEKATAYWKAPFSKLAGEIFIADDTNTGVEYSHVRGRMDVPDVVDVISTPKLVTVDTSGTDKFSIYNDVARKLKEVRYPELNVEVDVKNFRNSKNNSYNLFDRVYVKIPTYDELVTATVSKTVKNAFDIGENTVELNNYSVNNKAVPAETMIDGENVRWKYPNKGVLTVTLINLDGTVKPSKRMVTFNLLKVENGSITNTGKTYRRTTNSQGVARLVMKFTPGNYKMEVTFGGDSEFESCSATFSLNVSGIVQKKKTAKKSNASKKTKLRKVTRNEYYNQYGHSPDGKTLLAIGRASTPSEKKKFKGIWKTIFRRKCPNCGSKKLDWAWHFGNIFKGKIEGGSNEGTIICEKCGASFSVFGEGGRKDLSIIEQPRRATVKEARRLKAGRYLYQVYSYLVSQKMVNLAANKNKNLIRGAVGRGKFTCPNQSGSISEKVKSQALNIAKNYEGVACAKEIARWISANIENETREGLYQEPSRTLARKKGNDACRTDLFLQMCDAAGVQKSGVACYYVWMVKKEKRKTTKNKNNEPHITQHVFARVNGVWVDFNRNGFWGNYQTGFGKISDAKITRYPCLPYSKDY